MRYRITVPKSTTKFKLIVPQGYKVTRIYQVVGNLAIDAEFKESEHKRDEHGRFAKADASGAQVIEADASKMYDPTPVNFETKLSDGSTINVKVEGAFPSKQTTLSGKEWEDFKGEQVSSAKGVQAFDALLKAQKGYIPAAFNHQKIGNIDLLWGNKRAGFGHMMLRHHNYKDMPDFYKKLTDTINNGVLYKENGKDDNFVLYKNGIIAYITKGFKGIDGQNFFISGYKVKQRRIDKKYKKV